jgi:hypothetical protein
VCALRRRSSRWVSGIGRREGRRFREGVRGGSDEGSGNETGNRKVGQEGEGEIERGERKRGRERLRVRYSGWRERVRQAWRERVRDKVREGECARQWGRTVQDPVRILDPLTAPSLESLPVCVTVLFSAGASTAVWRRWGKGVGERGGGQGLERGMGKGLGERDRGQGLERERNAIKGRKMKSTADLWYEVCERLFIVDRALFLIYLVELTTRQLPWGISNITLGLL